MILPPPLRYEPILWPLMIVLILIYAIPHTSIPARIDIEVQRQYQRLPAVNVDFHPSRTFRNRFSTNRTVLYVETRNSIMHATPLLLHMTQVVPPEWRFVFLGTQQLIDEANSSSPVRRLVQSGKLRLGNVERWTDRWKEGLDIREVHSRLLTNVSFYDEQLPGVEWLMSFRSSAIVCANANRTINDYLDYDWVGAPWNANDNFGGNGGLSIRKVSKVREVLAFQTRLPDTESEDRWLSNRIALLRNSNCANATIERDFAVEDVWSPQPLGYHINPNLAMGTSMDVWNEKEKRKHIYEYCPEIKIIMDMRLERERCQAEVPVPDTTAADTPA